MKILNVVFFISFCLIGCSTEPLNKLTYNMIKEYNNNECRRTVEFDCYNKEKYEDYKKRREELNKSY